MKIDASRFNLFWSNPERYRLREIWKIAPKEPPVDSFNALYTYGRRRGTSFHELADARFTGVPVEQVLQELTDGQMGASAIAAAQRMAAAVAEKYPNESYLAHEVLFEYQIPNSPHIMTGRIDHILRWTGDVPVWFFDSVDGLPNTAPCGSLIIGDWKTSKKRTKKDMEVRKQAYLNSKQVDFYLLGAKTLGFDTDTFLYRILEDQGKGKPAVIHECWTQRSNLQLQATARYVHQTCELIEWMKSAFGVENAWPNLYEPFENTPIGYGSELGCKQYAGVIPQGFVKKVEHLETMMDDEEEFDVET